MFLDYFDDHRSHIQYAPDWLISPPPANPYLVKTKMVTQISPFVQLIYNAHMLRQQDKKQEFDARTSLELPREQQTDRKRVVNEKLKKTLKRLEEAKQDKQLE